LALARCSDTVGNNACHIDIMQKLTGKTIGKQYRLEKYTACG
jgi:formylmethanofuran dehydrogenase subunit E